jgi:hypothetical protein
MKIGVSLKIDVSKIEKARLYKGEKGTYLDAIAFIDIDTKDQYGNNGMITQAVSKDEKAAGVKGPILGNARVFFSDEISQKQPEDYRGYPGSDQRNPTYAPSKQQGKASMKDYANSGGGDYGDFGDEIPFMRLASSYAIG